jgi:archaellum component FlaC
MYGWSMSTERTITGSETALKDVLKLINVVPNPYNAFSEYEISQLDNRIKIYNEKYYAEHKKDITEKLLIKLECPNCGKLISKANLERHKIGKSCLKNASKQQSQLKDMQTEIERLSNEIKELKTK